MKKRKAFYRLEALQRMNPLTRRSAIAHSGNTKSFKRIVTEVVSFDKHACQAKRSLYGVMVT